MSRALAALAARVVGTRVQLAPCPRCGLEGRTGTVTRVTGRGLTVAIPALTASDVARTLEPP